MIIQQILRNKLRAISFFFFLTISFLSFSQNLKVEYKATFDADIFENSTKMSSKQKRMFKQMQKRLKESVENQKIVLYTKSENQFLLVVEDQMSIDGQFNSYIGVSLLNLHSYVYGQTDSIVLGYTKEESFIVKYENRFVEWEITDESKNILGFKCFKAIPKYLQSYEERELNSYPTEAWFAPSINRRGGPIKYSNLPGLILEVKSVKSTITAKLIEDIVEDKEVPQIDKKIITELQAYKKAKATGAAIESRMK